MNSASLVMRECPDEVRNKKDVKTSFASFARLEATQNVCVRAKKGKEKIKSRKQLPVGYCCIGRETGSSPLFSPFSRLECSSSRSQ